MATLMDNHMIVILVVFFALVIGMCASIVVSCWGKIQERRQRELDYKMRVSSHPSLDAIDRMNLVIGAPGTKQMQAAAAAAAAAGMMGTGTGTGGHLPAAATQLLRNAKNAALLQQQQQQQSHQLLLLSSRNNSEEMDDQMMVDEEEESPEDDGMMMMEEEEIDEDEEEVNQEAVDEEEEDEDATATCYVSELGGPVGRTGSGLLIMDDNAYTARLAAQHSVESNQSADLISPSDSCPLFYQHATSRNAGGTCNPLLYTHQTHHHLLHPLQVMPATDSSVHSNASNGSESPIPPPPPPPAVAHLRSCPARAGTPMSIGGSSCALAGANAAAAAAAAAALSLDVTKLPHAGSLAHLNAASSHPQLYHAVSQGTPPAPPPPQSAVMLSRHLSQRQLQPLSGSLLHCAHAPSLRQTIGSMASGSLDSEQPVSEPAPGSKQMLLR